MKTFLSISIAALAALSLHAGEIDANFRWADEVRSLCADELIEWASDPTGTTTCGGPCCIDGNASCTAAAAPFDCCTGSGTGTCVSENDKCTGASAPSACCTGSGTGTCHLTACTSFASKARANFSYWCQYIEEKFQDDGDWSCQTRQKAPNQLETVCSVVNASPLGDIRGYASFLAFAEENP